MKMEVAKNNLIPKVLSQIYLQHIHTIPQSSTEVQNAWSFTPVSSSWYGFQALGKLTFFFFFASG
jgi:hypothetical protein